MFELGTVGVAGVLGAVVAPSVGGWPVPVVDDDDEEAAAIAVLFARPQNQLGNQPRPPSSLIA